MHASISTHLSAYWLLDEDKGMWGPNMEEFRRARARPAFACPLLCLTACSFGGCVSPRAPRRGALPSICCRPPACAHLRAFPSPPLINPRALQFTPRRRRLGTPEAKERVANLYFAYLLVLRAVVKVCAVCVGSLCVWGGG